MAHMRRSTLVAIVGAFVVFVLWSGYNDSQLRGDLRAERSRNEVWADRWDDLGAQIEPEGIEIPSAEETEAAVSPPSVRIQGDQGPQGERGQTGPRGPQGESGTTGAAGTTGRPGGLGSPGEDGTDGTQGDAGVAGTDGQAGPQGEQGPPGPEGPQGATGPGGGQGPAGPPGPMPAAIVIPAEGGGTCTATDPTHSGTYECHGP